VDKGLMGAGPSDLIVELPTRFELRHQLQNRQATGLAVPGGVACGEALAATSSTRMATVSQPRNLLSTEVQPSIWSFILIDRACLGRSGGFAPVSFPLLQGTRQGRGVGD
jgi:hypothetical protein